MKRHVIAWIVLAAVAFGLPRQEFLTQWKAANAGGAWTPLDVEGLVGWFDAADTNTITVSAGHITQWVDKSGEGNHAIPKNITAPTSGTETLNSFNVIACVSQGLYVPYNINLECTAVLVYKRTGANLYSFGRSHSGINDRFYMDSYDTTTPEISVGSFGQLRSVHTMTDINDWRVRTFAMSESAREAYLKIGGESLETFALTGSDIIPAGQYGFGIGVTADGVNSLHNFGSHHNVNVAEVIIYDRVLTVGEMNKIESYITGKWGL